MKKLKNHFYVTECNSNGTVDLIITDQDHQIIGTVEEAITSSFETSSTDSFGGLTYSMYGESIGYIDYSDEEEMIEGILNDEYSDFRAVSHVSSNYVFHHIAVSPVQKESDIISRINEIVGYNLFK